LGSTAASAQSNLVHGGLSLGVLQGEFADNVGTYGGGISIGYLYQPEGSFFGFGGEIGGILYGQDTYREALLSTVFVEVETTNSIATGHLALRAMPPEGAIRPYAEGLLGFHYLFTQSRVELDDTREDTGITDTNFDDIVLSGGGGIGALVRLTSGVSQTGQPYSVYLDVRARYLWGGFGEYLGSGDITRDADGDGFIDTDVNQNGQIDEFEIARVASSSRTDLFLPQIGVAFRF
jgi:hypothetical protein